MKDLKDVKGTIANLLVENMNKLNSIKNPEEMRSTVLDLLRNSAISDKKAVDNAIERFSKARENAIYSMVSTYILGERII